MGKPYLPNISEIMSMGINPKTGLPYKFSGDNCTLKDDIKRVLRIIDEQDAVERFHWVNLPDGLDGELIERVLYYRGQGAFFFMETDGKFYFLPYALDGSIDVYGRYTGITPLPFNGSAADGKDKPWIVGLKRKPVYGLKLPEELELEDFTDGCVLLHDYSKQISQTTIPRRDLNEPIISVEAEMLPLMRTAAILGTGVKGMRVDNADEADSVKVAGKSLENAALTGQGYVPIIGHIEFQELTDGANLKGADYMQAMESIDNFRLGTYGIENGGLFQKKSHMLETEQAMAGGSTGLVYQNSLSIRQRFCDIVNSIWGLGIAVLPSESVMGGDINKDGVGFDQDESTGYSNNNQGESDNDTDV